MTYSETLDFLFSQLPMYQRIGKAAYKADLLNTRQLDAYFQHPHLHFKAIHVAGTNGKGSTSHMLAAILQEQGYKVGLYTSPHLRDFRERIRINGKMISEQEVVDFVANHRAILDEVKPSFFEMTVALAFDYFARMGVEVVVVETGMGGRLDSTNIISPLLSVVTNIGLDHTEFLGDTIAKVAAEKAGIFKPNTPVVVGEWESESAEVFEKVAAEVKSPLIFADNTLLVGSATLTDGKQCFEVEFPQDFPLADSTYCIDLQGSYQQKNILTVLATIGCLKQYGLLEIAQEAVTAGLAKAAQVTGLQGRWQVLSNNPLCICDTGHNAHGMQHSMAQLKQLAYNHLYVVLGVVSDKDLQSILPLLPTDAYYFFTQANLPRAMNAQLLADQCTAYGLKGEVIPSVPQAYEVAKAKAGDNDVVFVGGSTFVVAEVV